MAANIKVDNDAARGTCLDAVPQVLDEHHPHPELKFETALLVGCSTHGLQNDLNISSLRGSCMGLQLAANPPASWMSQLLAGQRVSTRRRGHRPLRWCWTMLAPEHSLDIYIMVHACQQCLAVQFASSAVSPVHHSQQLGCTTYRPSFQ